MVEEVMGTNGEGRRLDLGGELTVQGTDGVLYIVCLKPVQFCQFVSLTEFNKKEKIYDNKKIETLFFFKITQDCFCVVTSVH